MITVQQVKETTCDAFGLTLAELTGRDRSRNIVIARHVAMYVIRLRTDASLIEIGRAFMRDHTTVIAAMRKFERPGTRLGEYVTEVLNRVSDVERVKFRVEVSP